MQYRRLGRAGLQVSELSLGSWVTYANQVDVDAAVEMMAAAYDAGVNFFDNAEAYAGGKSEEVMGAALKKLGWARLNYTVSTKFFWGLPDAAHRQPQEHAQPQVPDAGHRRLAAALRPRLPRPRLLPPRRPEHAGRGDRARDERHDHAGQGALLGHQRVDGVRHPRRLGHRRPPPPAQAGGRAAAVPPVPPREGREGIRAPVRRHRPGPDHLEPARLGPADRQVQGRHPGRQPRRDAEHGLPAGGPDRPGEERGRRAGSSRSRATSARPPPSWPSPGWRRTRA